MLAAWWDERKDEMILTDPPYAHGHMDGSRFTQTEKLYRSGFATGDAGHDVLEGQADLVHCDVAPMLIGFHARDPG